MTDLCTVKRRINVPRNAFIAEQATSIIQQQKGVVKYKDPGRPTVSCMLGDKYSTHALLDLTASVNLLPYSLYQEMGLKNIKPTRVTLQLVDRSVKVPRGIVKDVLVKVSDFYYLVDFIVLDTQTSDDTIPLIPGRPFLATANALINCRNGSMTLTFGNLTVEVNICQLMKHPSDVDMIEEVCVIDSLVEEMVDHSFSDDALKQCLSYFGSNFDLDDSINEVNALLESTPLMDIDNWANHFEPLQLETFLTVNS